MSKDQGYRCYFDVCKTEFVGESIGYVDSNWHVEIPHVNQKIILKIGFNLEYCLLDSNFFRTYRIPSPRVGRQMNRKGKTFKRKIPSMKKKKGFRRG